MKDNPELPEGWTDDLSVNVAPDHTLDELVDFIIESERRGTRRSDVLRTLTVDFALSFDDARLALDRVRGGQMRAATVSKTNMPDAVKDPIAYISYQRARGLPAPPRPTALSQEWQNL